MRKYMIIIVVINMLVMAGCKNMTRFGKIGKPKVINLEEINDHPELYLNKECTVRGYVTNVLDIPFIRPDCFKIFDGTDEIWVFTNRGVPPHDVEVLIKGKVRGIGSSPIALTLDISILTVVFRPEMQFGIELQELDFL